jgi:hypothetical protein
MVEGFFCLRVPLPRKFKTICHEIPLNLKFAGEKDLTPSINFRTEGEKGKRQSVVAKGNAIPQKLAGTQQGKRFREISAST